MNPKHQRLVLALLILTVFLTGCVSTKTRNSILSSLERKNYIEESWTLTDSFVVDASPVPDILYYGYVYEDSSHRLNEITIRNQNSDEAYPVTIYYDVQKNITENPYYDETSESQEEYVTEYDTDSCKFTELNAVPKKVLFYERMTITDAE